LGYKTVERIPKYEKNRLALQAELDAAKTQLERNRLGQFATPTELAIEVLKYAKKIIPKSTIIRFLDPGFGTGAFYSALLRVYPKRRISAAVGFEIDSYYFKPASDIWNNTPLKMKCTDFTSLKAPKRECDRFNLIICNPPYIRHHHIPAIKKQRLQDLVKEVVGIEISGLAGLYCHFLLLTHLWMKKNGIAGWLIPSEFMDVNYGNSIKEYLFNKVTLLRIHRFDPNNVQFQDALVSSAIVWFSKANPSVNHKVEFTFGGTLLKPSVFKRIEISSLRKEKKWTRFPVLKERKKNNGLVLGDLFHIKRGLATGDNKFFILTKERIKQLKLSMKHFQPILPSPRYVKNDEIQSDSKGNPVISPQLFLLNCRLNEAEIQKRFPSLWKYLQTGKEIVAKRYLCSHRSPWYSQENRPAPPILCTYMGRKAQDGRPFRFILNKSQATATNVYLMLYPKPQIAHEFYECPKVIRKIWNELNNISIDSILDEGRVYGGGLHKLEPKELANVPADCILNHLKKTKLFSQRQLSLFPD